MKKLFFAVLLGLSLQASAQLPPEDMPIDGAVRAATIAELAKKTDENYVFPEVGKKINEFVQGKLTRGEYDSLGQGLAFAKQLTEDVQSISHDKHFRINFNKGAQPLQPVSMGPPDAAAIARRSLQMQRLNYGFSKIESLEGNIAYLELRGFMDAVGGAATAAAAMNMVAHADALIIDLRRNGGGSPDMVALISSYLFDNEKVHLNSLYFRPSNETRDFYTDPKVAGLRYGSKKPVYILTSKRTFSAAEEFTYNLKNLKRATIIGETTGGGANPGGVVQLTANFSAFVPTGRAINPITKTNWEGTGIAPDVAVAADQALNTAYALALKPIIAVTTDARAKAPLEQKLAELEAKK